MLTEDAACTAGLSSICAAGAGRAVFAAGCRRVLESADELPPRSAQGTPSSGCVLLSVAASTSVLPSSAVMYVCDRTHKHLVCLRPPLYCRPPTILTLCQSWAASCTCTIAFNKLNCCQIAANLVICSSGTRELASPWNLY